MTKIMQIGLIIPLILLFGISCTPQIKERPRFSPSECVPDIEIVEKRVELGSELTENHPNPTVPTHGDNSVLLEWCLACAANNRKLNLQMDAIRELQDAPLP